MSSKANIVGCKVTREGFIDYWLQFLGPVHKMTSTEIKIFSALARKRIEISKTVLDDDLADYFVFQTEFRKELCKQFNISSNHLQVVLGNLCDKKVLTREKLNDRLKLNKNLIPDFDSDTNEYKLVLKFTIND